MNSRDLRSFAISLKYHLGQETELFDAGLIDQPAVISQENAKRGTMVAFVGETPARILRRHIKGVPFPIGERREIVRRVESTTDFRPELKKRPEIQWDPTLRRRV